MSKSFRFIPYEIFEGAHNMAIDEAILDAHREGASPATLRIYGWQPHAVSLGYAQKFSKEQVETFEKRGFAVVRRPTGGRAVLHTGELTYSFVASTVGDSSDGVLGTSVAQAYMQICQGLLNAMAILGVELSVGSASRSYKDFHDCFQATTNADLHYNGKKMIGSAQLRRGNAVLQHGSILLEQPQELMADLLGGTPSAPGVTRHANLFEVLESSLSVDEMQDALKKGFEEAFDSPFAKGELTEWERQLAESYRTKYEFPSLVQQ
jgi:Lipoate-protein ligase A